MVIQGPPGTGKTYIGVKVVQTLLANPPPPPAGMVARRGGAAPATGPILCLCFTNHALDQFLESLLKKGITSIIRVGGRSKSPVLEGKNLRDVPRDANDRIPRIGILKKQMEEIKGKFLALQKQVKGQNPSWKDLEPFAEASAPDVYRSIERAERLKYEVDEDGFTRVRRFQAPLVHLLPTISLPLQPHPGQAAPGHLRFLGT